MTVFAGKAGVVCGAKEFTFEEFGQRCGKLAAALKALGVARGDRVAYLSFNTHKLLEGYYGVPQAGAIVIPLNVRFSAAELVEIGKHAEPAALFYEREFAGLVEEFRTQCKSIRHYVALDEGSGEELSYEELLAAHPAAQLDISAVTEDDIAELFYTSGSTGTPKGVALSHRALYFHALSVATIIMDPQTAVDLATIPLFHANGWGFPQAAPLMGVTQVMVRRFDPVNVMELIERHRATEMSIIPLMGNALLNVPEPGRFDFSSMRQIQIGGAASSPALIERLEKLFHCDVFAGYGLTESGPVLTMARLKEKRLGWSDEERWRRQASTGWPIPGAMLRVVDDQMCDLPKDGKSVGEIVASSDWLMSGYYKDPEATAAVLTSSNGEPGGPAGAPVWLHTGDMAVWDEEGYFTIVDRKKEIIISGGENISSLEIEKIIYSHPAVLECAVVAAPDEHWGEVPVAVVYVKPGESLSSDELLAYLSGRLGRFKVPKQLLFADEPLPKTGTGKIKKREIREPFWKGHEKRVKG
jgi:fatty-acyl-CoA synthase